MRPTILAIVLLLASAPAWAATVHVRTGGNASTNCTNAQTNTDANAFPSIGQAIRNCGGAGQTIQVHSGQYDEAFDNNTFYRNGGSTTGTFPSGSSGNPFVIEGAAAESRPEIRPSQSYAGGVFNFNNGTSWVTLRRLVLDSRNQALPNATGSVWAARNPSQHWTLEDVEARNSRFTVLAMGDDSEPDPGRRCDRSCFHTFTRVNAHDACRAPYHDCNADQQSKSHGAYVACSDNTFTGGEYWHGGHGIQSYCDPGGSILGQPRRNKFYGNKFHDNLSPGLAVYSVLNDTQADLEVINNLSYNNAGAGIWIVTNDAIAYGNTTTGNAGAGMSCAQWQNSDQKNNLSVANGGSEFEDCNNATQANGNIAGNNPNDFFVSAFGGDYHIANFGSPAVNAGVNLPSPYMVDIENAARPFGAVTAGSYQFGASAPPPTPDPFLIVGKYTFDQGTGTTAADSSGNSPSHPCALNSAGWVIPGIIGAAALNLTGPRWCEVPGDSSLRPANEFCLSGWFRSSTPQNCDLVSMGDSYAARIEPTGHLAGFYYDGSSWTTGRSTLATMTDGVTHHWVVTKDLTGIRTWIDRAQGPLTATTGTISYGVPLGPNLQIGRHGNGDTSYVCSGVLDQVYVMRGSCDQGTVDVLYADQVSVTGTSQTHSQFERANFAIGSILATDADLPEHDRTQAVALAVAIQRAGTTTTQYYALECSRNGGVFTTLTNLFGTFGARIAPDSVVNMGDSVPVTLPTGAFTAVPGHVVADTINTGFTTTLNTGQQTQWRYTIDFGGDAVAGNTYDCRPAGFGAGNYFNVKRVTLVDPPPSGVRGSILRGVTFR